MNEWRVGNYLAEKGLYVEYRMKVMFSQYHEFTERFEVTRNTKEF
jgi:hypothetical protein